MNRPVDIELVFIFSLFLISAGIAGGGIPLGSRFKERGLHSLLALGTGMLLGTIFLHMLPEAVSAHGSPLLVLVGLLVVFTVERLVFAAGHPMETPHKVISLSAFFGLSLHAFIVGLGLATQLSDPLSRTALMISLLIHKLSETFALGTVFVLAGFTRNRTLVSIIAFSCITPAALILGRLLIGQLPVGWLGAASGLATGTFLYVALVDLLPEVFHHPKGRWGSFGMLLVGILVIYTILSNMGHGH